MADLLAAGATWLAATLKSGVSQSVKVTRGAETLQIDATIGNTEFQIDTEEGPRLEHCDRTYVVTAADYKFDGQVVLPQAGDIFTDTVEAASGESTFEVMHPTGLQPYQFDRHGVKVRIFTKRVSTNN